MTSVHGCDGGAPLALIGVSASESLEANQGVCGVEKEAGGIGEKGEEKNKERERERLMKVLYFW